MHASSPGRGALPLPCSDSCAALAPWGPAPPCEKLPSHVVHDDAKRAELEAIIQAHYPCALVRFAARGAVGGAGAAGARPRKQ
jgi:hypothetical protein